MTSVSTVNISIVGGGKHVNLVVFQLHQTVCQGWVASSVPPQMHCGHTPAEVTAAPGLSGAASTGTPGDVIQPTQGIL